MRAIILLFLMTLALGSCAADGHEPLKAPCGPLANLGAGTGESPCGHVPVNLASL